MKYSKIKINDIVNSSNGINLSIWTQGCPHHCKGCFNKETWGYDSGIEFNYKTLDYIFENIDKYIKRNLSILGGEPLCPVNVEGVYQLCKEFKAKYPNKKIYLWTGYSIENFNNSQKKVLDYIDILIDGKFEEDKKNINLKLRGSSNQRVIDVKETIKLKKMVLEEL